TRIDPEGVPLRVKKHRLIPTVGRFERRTSKRRAEVDGPVGKRAHCGPGRRVEGEESRNRLRRRLGQTENLGDRQRRETQADGSTSEAAKRRPAALDDFFKAKQICVEISERV